MALFAAWGAGSTRALLGGGLGLVFRGATLCSSLPSLGHLAAVCAASQAPAQVGTGRCEQVLLSVGSRWALAAPRKGRMGKRRRRGEGNLRIA